MLLSRTRHLAKLRVKAFVFDKGNFQELLDVRRRHKLEDSMGFRGQWDEHRRFQITFLKERGLEPQHDFLEIGCGPLTGGIPLIEYLEPGKYVGVDIRSSVLNVSWGEIGLAGLSEKNRRLICSSSFGDEELGERQFDFVFSFSVLYHLSDDILRDYFRNVISAPETGRFRASHKSTLISHLALGCKHPLKAAGGRPRDGQAARSIRAGRQFQGNSAARSLIL